MLYSESQTKDASSQHMEKYMVYRADQNDITYTQNFYNMEDCSMNLLKSKEVVSLELMESQPSLKFVKRILTNAIITQ